MPKVFLKVSTENNPQLVEGEDFVSQMTSSHISDFATAVQALAGAGTTVSSGELTRSAATASGTQEVVLGFRPSMVFFSSIDSLDPNSNSDGWDDGTTSTCSSIVSANFLTSLLGALGLASLSTKSHTQSIWIQSSSGDGHQGRISEKSDTSFTLEWTKLNAGRNITVKYLAIR